MRTSLTILYITRLLYYILNIYSLNTLGSSQCISSLNTSWFDICMWCYDVVIWVEDVFIASPFLRKSHCRCAMYCSRNSSHRISFWKQNDSQIALFAPVLSRNPYETRDGFWNMCRMFERNFDCQSVWANTLPHRCRKFFHSLPPNRWRWFLGKYCLCPPIRSDRCLVSIIIMRLISKSEQEHWIDRNSHQKTLTKRWQPFRSSFCV